MPARSTLALLGVAALAPAAFAQGSDSNRMRIYGIIDSAVETARTSGGSTNTRLTGLTWANAASRLGFDVREDLGGGLYAAARLEHGFESDTGSSSSATKYFNRGSWVSLGGTWGELRVGRDYTPAFYVLSQGDINGLNLYGNAGTYAHLGPSNFVSSDNAVNYISPSVFNTVVRASITAGDESAVAPKDAGRVAGLSATYDDRTMMIGAYHMRRRDVFPANATRTEKATLSGISARWRSDGWSLSAGAARWNPAGPDTLASGVVASWWLGASLHAGIGEVRVQGGRIVRRSITAVEPRATLYGVSYLHPLSKRTTVYASYGRLNNNERGSFQLQAGSRTIALPVAEGIDTSGLSIGITHRF